MRSNSNYTRRILAVLALVSIVGCSDRRVSRENFLKLQEGMTLSGVESILGASHEQSTDRCTIGSNPEQIVTPSEGPGIVCHVWRGGPNGVEVIVLFQQDKVVFKTAVEKR